MAILAALRGTAVSRGLGARWVSNLVCTRILAQPPFAGAFVASFPVHTRTLAAPRDPDRPKKPETTFLRFLRDFREANKGRFAPKEVMQHASVEWHKLPETDRARYLAAYEAQKKDYDAAYEAYKASGKATSAKRDPSKPVMPQSGYLLFAAEVRAQNPGMKVTEQMKLAGAQWQALTDEAKLPYIERAAPALEAWRIAMAEYKESGKGEAWKASKPLSPKEIVKAQEAVKKALEKEKEKSAEALAKLRVATLKARERVAAEKAKAKEAVLRGKIALAEKELRDAKMAQAKGVIARTKARVPSKMNPAKAKAAQDRAKIRARAQLKSPVTKAKAATKSAVVAARAAKAKAKALAVKTAKAEAKLSAKATVATEQAAKAEARVLAAKPAKAKAKLSAKAETVAFPE